MQILFTECLDFYFDQLQSNSCSNNGLSIILYLLMKKYNIYPFITSRLFLYYNAREFINDTNIDQGTTNNGLFYSLEKYGMCPEILHPFDVSKITEEPHPLTYEFSANFPVKFFCEEKFMNQKNWIELISKTLLNRQFLLIVIKREGEHSTTFQPVGDFNTFPIVDYIKHYHHVICVGIDTDKKLVYLLNSHGMQNNNIVSVTFNQMTELNPLEPDICIIDADFSKCNSSLYYHFIFKKSCFFSYPSLEKDYKLQIETLTPLLHEEFGNKWCFQGDTSLFILYEKLNPRHIPRLNSSKINVLVPFKTKFQLPNCLIQTDPNILRKHILFCWKIITWSQYEENIIKTISSFNHKILITTTRECFLNIPRKDNIKVLINVDLNEKTIENERRAFKIGDKKNVYLLNQPTLPHYHNINAPIKDLLFSIYNIARQQNYNITSFYDFPLLDFNIEQRIQGKNSFLWKKIVSIYQSCIFNVQNPFILQNQYIDTEISHDHVIVGTGVCGRFLAKKLKKEFPRDSILLIDENVQSNNCSLYFDNCKLPFKNVKSFGTKDVITKRVLKKYSKEKSIQSDFFITREEIKQICKIIFKNYTIDIEFLFDTKEEINEDKMYLIVESLSSIKELCCYNDDDFFSLNGFDISSIKKRNQKNTFQTMSEPCFSFKPEGTALDFLLSCIYAKTNIFPLGESLREFQYECLQSFSLQTFGDFLMNPDKKQHCILDGVSIHDIQPTTNKISLFLQLQPETDIVNSSFFNINFKELYICSPKTEWTKDAKKNICFHFCFPNTNSNYNYFLQENMCYTIDNEFIWITFHEMEKCLQEIKSFPFDILTDFYYESTSIPSIFSIFLQYIPFENIKRSLGFVMTCQKVAFLTSKENNLHHELMEKLQISSNIHHLYHQILPSPLENSFFLVEKFMSKMRRIGILNTKKNYRFVGFKQETDIENCNFIYSEEPCVTEIYKPIVLVGISILWMMVKDQQEIVSFKNRHYGFFDVYCSLTNKIKYENLFFNNEKGIEFTENFKSDNFSVLTFYIWEEKRYIASVRHKFKNIYGFQNEIFHFESNEYNNQMNFLKSL